DPPGDRDSLVSRCAVPHDGRIGTLHQALRAGAKVAELTAASGIDPWFIEQVKSIEDLAEQIARGGPPTPAGLRAAKSAGFSDAQLAELLAMSELQVRSLRRNFEVHPVFHMVDTCAAEFAASTPYLYSSYDELSEVTPSSRPKVIILGSGPN